MLYALVLAQKQEQQLSVILDKDRNYWIERLLKIEPLKTALD
jgi:hypothetical protein